MHVLQVHLGFQLEMLRPYSRMTAPALLGTSSSRMLFASKFKSIVWHGQDHQNNTEKYGLSSILFYAESRAEK
jgi:hypothetical protein